MKFVAFRKPDIKWDGLDWVYNLMEDKNSPYYDFFLVDTKSAKRAREIVIEEMFNDTMQKHGIECVIERAFDGFTCLEYEDNELLEFLGEKDGKTALGFYEKYGYEAFSTDDFKFCDPYFAKEDREKFYTFDEENLKKLYSISIWYDVLVMPINKDLARRK